LYDCPEDFGHFSCCSVAQYSCNYCLFSGFGKVDESGAATKAKDSLGKSGKEVTKSQKINGSIATGGCETAIKARLQELTVALASSDAKTLSAIWLEDGTYSNEMGQEWRGRAALEKRFTAVFASEGRLYLISFLLQFGSWPTTWLLLTVSSSLKTNLAAHLMLASRWFFRSRLTAVG
jgi:hypothetical protein